METFYVQHLLGYPLARLSSFALFAGRAAVGLRLEESEDEAKEVAAAAALRGLRVASIENYTDFNVPYSHKPHRFNATQWSLVISNRNDKTRRSRHSFFHSDLYHFQPQLTINLY